MACAPVSLCAQEPYLVRDINTEDRNVSSEPRQLVAAGGALFFTAEDALHGRELWKSDGTPKGTLLVKDIHPGGQSSNPYYLTSVDGVLFFVADDGLSGEELWKSDGTARGTRRVADLYPGPEGSSPRYLTAVGRSLYFSAASALEDRELWTSNGTESSTRQVEDIWPGFAGSNPRDLVEFRDQVFFRARSPDGGPHGRWQLWRSDGTSEGTAPVIENAGELGADYPEWITPVDGWLYFVSRYSRLWRTDGAAEGTTQVTRGLPGEPLSLSGLTGAHGILYFVGQAIIPGEPSPGRELWKSDGTRGGTVQVADINPGSQGSNPRGMTPADSGLFFVAYRSDVGSSLWKTDGSEAGTHLVTSLHDYRVRSEGLLWHEGRLFFQGNDGSTGWELWASDGTEAGTHPIADIRPQGGNAEPRSLTAFQGQIYFSADGASSGPRDRELWGSDGTSEGTRLVRNIWTATQSSDPFGGVVVGDRLVFSARDGEHGAELWTSDGTRAGTRLVRDINPGPDGSHPSGLASSGKSVIFSADDGRHGVELWRSSGSAEDTSLVLDIRPGPASSAPGAISPVGELVFFTADDGEIGREPWRTDGSQRGTWALGDLNPAGNSSSPYEQLAFAGVRGLACFAADDGETGKELWRSDGTVAGTFRLADIYPGPDSSRVSNLVGFGDEIYFSARGPDEIPLLTLWRSDGSGRGTRRVTYNTYPDGPFSLQSLTPVGNRLFFSANSGGVEDRTGREPWTSDGTHWGTRLLADLRPGDFPSSPGSFVDLDGRAVFRATRERFDQLWISDGTPGGVRALTDLDSVALTAAAPVLTAQEGLALFTRWPDEIGSELWVSDGTAGGTVLVEDLVAGSDSSHPRFLGGTGRRFFFTASNKAGDRELWAYRPMNLSAAPRALVLQGMGRREASGLAVLDPDDGTAHVLDLANGNRVKVLSFYGPDWDPLGMESIRPSLGAPAALAVLARHRQYGLVEARLHLPRLPVSHPRGLRPGVALTVRFAGTLRPEAFGVLASTRGASGTGLVVAGRRLEDWKGMVEARGLKGELLFQTALGEGTVFLALEGIPDLTGDGRQELAVLARTEEGHGRILVLETANGRVLSEMWLASDSDPVSLRAVPNVTWTPSAELAVLLRSRVTGESVVQVRDATGGQVIGEASLGRNFRPMAMALLRSARDFVSSPLAIVGRRADGGLEARVVDPVSGGSGRVVFPAHLQPHALIAIPRRRGAFSPDLALVGWNPEDGTLRVQVKEVETGRALLDTAVRDAMGLPGTRVPLGLETPRTRREPGR